MGRNKAKKMINPTPMVKTPAVISSTRGVRIHQAVLNADCRLMLPGLVALCDKLKLRVEDRPHGNLIVFINTARNYVKVLACNGTRSPVLCCKRSDSGRMYDLAAVQEIPRCFRWDGTVDLDEALAIAVTKKMGKRQKN